MALSQQEYQAYLSKMEKLGLTPDPTIKPVESPVQAPVQAPQAQQTVPTPPTASFMDQFKQDYGQVQQTMRDTAPAETLKQSVAGATVEGLSKQVLEVLPDIGEMGGTMAGMYYGARMGASGGAYGVAGGALMGAMLGSGTGETIKQMFNNEFDPAKVINTVLVSGMLTGGMEGVGRAFELAGTSMAKLRAGKELTMDEIKSMDDLVKALEKEGITLTPAQLTGSNFQRTLEKVGKAGFGGEQKFADLYLAQDNFMADRLEALTKQVGNPDRKQTGDLIKQALEDADSNLLSWAEPKYAALNKAAKGEPLSLQGTMQSLRHKLAVGKQGRREGAKSTTDPEVEELYQYVLGNVQNTDFKQWFDMMKRLNADHRKVLGRFDNKNPTLEKAYADVFALLYKDAERSAAKYGTDVLQQYKDVTKVVRESKRTLNDSAIKMLAKKQPEFAGEAIFETGNVSSVQAAFKAMDEAEAVSKRLAADKPKGNVPIFNAAKAKDDLRAGYLEALFTKTELADTSAQTAAKLLEQIARDPKTKDTFNAMLPPQLQSEVKKVLGWGYQLEKNSAGNFSLIVRGRQSGELNKLANQATGNDATGFALTTTVKAIATITGPERLAKRAVGGKATNKYLTQLKDLTVKFDKGELKTTDMATLLGLWATDATEKEKLPLELRVPNLNSQEALRYHAARARAMAAYEKAGLPVPPEIATPANQRPEAPVSASPNTPLQVEVTQGQQ